MLCKTRRAVFGRGVGGYACAPPRDWVAGAGPAEVVPEEHCVEPAAAAGRLALLPGRERRRWRHVPAPRAPTEGYLATDSPWSPQEIAGAGGDLSLGTGKIWRRER